MTEQVGRCGRTVNEIADELGCDWHTVNDAVIAYGTALVDDDPERIGEPTAVGLDETLFVRLGRWRTAVVVNVDRRRPRRSPARRRRLVVTARAVRLVRRPRRRRGAQQIEWATLDLSGPVSRRVRHDAPRRHPGR